MPCLKRSCFRDMVDFQYHSEWFEASQIVYWRPNAAGYTNERALAGLYTGLDLENINGVHLDWMLDPVERDIFFDEL